MSFLEGRGPIEILALSLERKSDFSPRGCSGSLYGDKLGYAESCCWSKPLERALLSAMVFRGPTRKDAEDIF
jgi:hypothetical protein